MNNTKRLMAWALVALGIGAALVAITRQKQPSAPGPQAEAASAMPGAQIAPSPATAGASTSAPTSESVAATPPIRETKVLQESGTPKEIIRVKSEQVLATVNGAPVTLKDLVAIPAAQPGAEQTISASLYDTLLERAVVREVAVQAAQAKGIALTADQQAQLAKMQADMPSTSADVVDMTMSPERVAFEQRDTAGRMLLVNLVAEAGAPGAFVTEEQVKAYYEGHKADYGELPADPQEAEWAWRKIDREIRTTLAPDTANAYQQAYDQVVADLKAAATIHVTPTRTP